MPKHDAAPDGLISHEDGIEYWNSIPSNVNGMLGGFPEVSTIDLAGSKSFVKKLQDSSQASGSFGRGVDCGAGIGRVTKDFLSTVCNIVDIVEPIEKFTDVMKDSKEWSILRETGRLGQIYNIGLQDWIPQASYDLMWNQWCVGHLTDIELVEHLKRCKHSLNPRGWIVVKENLSSDPGDTFDEIDSSVTRTHDTFLRVFEMAGLQLGATEVQKGMPHGLYQVRSYALQ